MPSPTPQRPARTLDEAVRKISKIDILIVHVRLALPVHLKNHSFHLPVNPRIPGLQSKRSDVRKIVERASQLGKRSMSHAAISTETPPTV